MLADPWPPEAPGLLRDVHIRTCHIGADLPAKGFDFRACPGQCKPEGRHDRAIPGAQEANAPDYIRVLH